MDPVVQTKSRRSYLLLLVGTGSSVPFRLVHRHPDDNGVELYWDRQQDVWPRTPDGGLAMFTRRLDLNGLLTEAEPNPNAPNVGEGPQDS